MKGLVYILCAGTAFMCSALLLRGFRRSGTRLLLWCGLSFLSLVLENVILFIDYIIVPDRDLYLLRTLIGLIGVTTLLFGLIWDSR